MTEQTNTTENQQVTLGLGVDLRADAVRFGMCNKSKRELLSDTAGSNTFPSSFTLGPDGVEAVEQTGSSREVVEVLPRFKHRTESQKERDRARFRQELQTVFRTSKESFTNQNPGYEIDDDTDWNKQIAQARPVVTVPGAYDETDREDVRVAVRGVGWEPQAIIRAPLATAAAHFPSISEPEVLAVVDIGTHWCEIALVRIDPATVEYEVLSRVSLPGHGQEAMSRAVAEWALDETATELNREIQYTPAALDRLKQAATTALTELETNDQATISVPDLTEVDLEVGTPPIEVDQALDTGECDEVLGDILSRIIADCKQVVADVDLDRDDITGLLLSGSGSLPRPVRSTIGGFFDRSAQRPALGDTSSAAAHGAAVLATQMKNGQPPIVNTTLSREMGVLVQTNEGAKYESVVPAHAANHTHGTVELKTTEDDQTQGKLTVASRHAVVKEWDTISRYRVSGLPPKPAGEVTVELQLAAVDDRVEEISATVVSGDSDERPSQIDVIQIDDEEPTGPWFTVSDEQVSDLDLPDKLDESTRIELSVPDEQQYDEDPMRVVRSMMQVRYNIWKTVDEGATMSPSSLDSLLKQFDGSLKRIDVTPIDPDPGTEQDLIEHKKADSDTSTEYPEGTIIKVQTPGYKIGDSVEEPAEIVLSEGEPESKEGGSGPEGATETDAESAAGPDDDSEEEQETDRRESSADDPQETSEKTDQPDEKSKNGLSDPDNADDGQVDTLTDADQGDDNESGATQTSPFDEMGSATDNDQTSE